MQEQIRKLVEELKLQWNLKQNVKGGFIVSGSKFASVVQFFYYAIDKLMELANEFDVPGIVKKSAVMDAVNNLYDSWINPLLPLYLKPFSGSIKKLIVDTLISNLIDFLVDKVRAVKTT